MSHLTIYGPLAILHLSTFPSPIVCLAEICFISQQSTITCPTDFCVTANNAEITNIEIDNVTMTITLHDSSVLKNVRSDKYCLVTEPDTHPTIVNVIMTRKDCKPIS